MKQVIVDIANDGEIQIAATGFNGPICIKETQFLKDLLGHEIAVQLVCAYYATNEENTKQFLPICG